MLFILCCSVLDEAGMDQASVDSKRTLSQTELGGPWLRHKKDLRQRHHHIGTEWCSARFYQKIK